MKKMFFALSSALFLLASCKDADNKAATDNNSATSDMAKRNSDNTRIVYRGIESGDMNKVDSFIADDFVDHGGAMDGSDIKGREEFKKQLGDIHNHMDNMKFDVIADASSADGNYYFSLVEMTGTTRDNAMGSPAGTKMDAKSVDVVKIKDGKATDHWAFQDPKQMMEMMKAMQGRDMKPNGNMKVDTARKM